MKPDQPHHDGFADRLAYLRWVWHLEHSEAPTNEQIGRAAAHTGQWLTGLLKDKKAPTKGADHRALARYFGLVNEDWLIYNDGSPPRPELWALWLRARSDRKALQRAKPEPATRADTRVDRRPATDDQASQVGNGRGRRSR